MPKHSNKRPPTPAAEAARKLYKPSPELAAVIGAAPVSRQAATARVWDHIKAAELQKAGDRRVIVADAKLRPVLGRDEAGMFELGGLLAKHLTSTAAVA